MNTSQIKFRGKSIEKNEWVYGFYANIEEKEHYILQPCALGLFHCQVFPETVGRFTGLKTVNTSEVYDDSKEIYEGDIYTQGTSKTTFQIKFEWDSFIGVSKHGDDWGPYTSRLSINRKSIVIVGNVSDNPELLNGAS